MKKKIFVIPGILLEGSGIGTGGGPDPGLGSGQTTTDEEPWSWEMWSVMYDEDDSDGNGTPGEWTDYVAWMTARGWDDRIDWNENPNP